MLERVLNNDKQFEDYAAKHTSGYIDTEKALEVVRKFIIDHDLIIYGGMAIDLALKAKGHKGIYKDDAVPDFDFMSPKHYEHACELADLLNKKGFGDVQAVNAVHVSTYKVRTNFVWVADITYIPMEVYKTIPTLKVEGLRIVHPDFQRLDMHRAMSTPYEKPPMEVFLHRARKDQKRFRMLDELYPLLKENLIPKKNSIPKGNLTQKEWLMPNEWIVPIELYKNNVIGGTQAYCVLYTVLQQMLYGTSKLAKSLNINIKNTIIEKFKTLPVASFSTNNNKMIFKISLNINLLNIISDDFENIINLLDSFKQNYYNKYVDDWRPRTVVLTNIKNSDFVKSDIIEIFDNKPRLLPVYNLKSVGKMLELKWPDNIDICTSQYILMYYLQKYFGGGFTKEGKLDKKNNDIYLHMYVATKTLIEIVENIYINLKDLSNEKLKNTNETNNNLDPINSVFEQLPFFLTDKVYGSVNWSPDYIVGVREQYYHINHIVSHEIMKPPRGYYLKEPPIKFDPSKSSFFQFDGLECPPFKPIELFSD